MKTFHYVITDEVGIHARPAGMLINKVKEYKAEVTILANGKSANAARMMAVMGLGIKKGMDVTVQIEGEDEEQAAQALEAFFRENL